jgi:hypothetical protein
MEFKNYCVVIMGETNGAMKEIEKISDSTPNVLDAKGIIISTFTSIMDVKEITEWFKSNNRSFLVFDLDENSSGVSITKENVHEKLFGFLQELNPIELNNKTQSFIKTVGDENISDENTELTETDIEKMSKENRQDLMNQFIDNGLENLTENDKKILSLLAKY